MRPIDFTICIRKINVRSENCAAGRDLRRIGHRANFRPTKFAMRKNEIEAISNSREEENGQGKIRSDFEHMHRYREFLGKDQSVRIRWISRMVIRG